MTSDTNQKLQMLTELAKLTPFELSAVMAKVERDRATKAAKAAKDTNKRAGRTFGNWGTPLNPR